MTRSASRALSLASFGLIAQLSLLAAVTDRQASRLLDQASWGPTPTDIANVQSLGLSSWIDAQFTATPSDLPDQPLLDVNSNTNTNLAPVRSAFFQNAVSGPDQLRQRVAFILSQIWVVSQQAGTSPAYAYPPYWRVLRDNAFGNYSDIIKNVTLSPAMGRYLNMANNNKASTGRSPNENYARELMQLFTLGIDKVNLDGSLALNNGNPVPTYTELDVENLAKAFTGWTYPTSPTAAAKTNNPEYYFGQMFSVATNHDTTAKTILGTTILANTAVTAASADLDAVIAILMKQSSLAPFVCKQLIQHLVTSNPSPQYVSRISNVFLNNGSGVTGDMKAVIKAILLDLEARSGDDPALAVLPNSGHLREPVLMMASILRGLNATLTTTNSINNYTSNLGENIFDEPSVFSYFSPSYRTIKGLYGPEFQIYSTQTSAFRSDYIYMAIYGVLDSTTKINLAPFNAKASDINALVDYISYVFLDHSASPDLITNATAAAKAATLPARAVQSALFVVLTSAQYQVTH